MLKKESLEDCAVIANCSDLYNIVYLLEYWLHVIHCYLIFHIGVIVIRIHAYII